MDASNLALEACGFDVITYLKTIWCVPRAEPCLAEALRVLRPGGKIVVQIYGAREVCPLVLLAPRILADVADDVSMPVSYRTPFGFSPELLSSLLAGAGFEGFVAREYAVEVAFESEVEYWQTIRSIAGSAYSAYARLTSDSRLGPALTAAWEKRVSRLRDVDRVVRLGLTWHICFAEKPPLR